MLQEPTTHLITVHGHSPAGRQSRPWQLPPSSHGNTRCTHWQRSPLGIPIMLHCLALQQQTSSGGSVTHRTAAGSRCVCRERLNSLHPALHQAAPQGSPPAVLESTAGKEHKLPPPTTRPCQRDPHMRPPPEAILASQPAASASFSTPSSSCSVTKTKENECSIAQVGHVRRQDGKRTSVAT
jgi:hypothetical protein